MHTERHDPFSFHTIDAGREAIYGCNICDADTVESRMQVGFIDSTGEEYAACMACALEGTSSIGPKARRHADHLRAQAKALLEEADKLDTWAEAEWRCSSDALAPAVEAFLDACCCPHTTDPFGRSIRDAVCCARLRSLLRAGDHATFLAEHKADLARSWEAGPAAPKPVLRLVEITT